MSRANCAKLGYRGIDTCEIFFENYRVPADRLIGGVEGQGLYQAIRAAWNSAASTWRRAVSAWPSGAAQARRRYAQIRKTFGKPICEHQAIQLKLGEMATRASRRRGC